MKYTEFVSVILREVKDRLGDGYDVGVQKTPRNNGDTQIGLSIRRIREQLALTVRLDPYFEQIGNGMTVGEAADDIIGACCESEMPEVNLKEVLDFNQAMGRVACRLVNTEANRKWLEGTPHIEGLDLSIIFYLLIGRSESGQMTVGICREQMEAWGVTVEELCRVAYGNMEHLFPVQIKTMAEVMREIVKRERGDSFVEEQDEECKSDLGGGSFICPDKQRWARGGMLYDTGAWNRAACGAVGEGSCGSPVINP